MMNGIIAASRLRADPTVWATDMVTSYRALNPEQAIWFDANPAIETELYNRILGLYGTFGTRTSAIFIYLMQVSGNTNEGITGNIGNILRWDMEGQIFNQNSIPTATLLNDDIITVTSTDNWVGITTWFLIGTNLKGAPPLFNLPNNLEFAIGSNNFSGTCPNYSFPYCYSFRIQGNSFSGICPTFNLPNTKSLIISSNDFTGNIPVFIIPLVINFRFDGNLFSGILPNYNYPNLRDIYAYSNQFTDIAGFDFITINTNDIRFQNLALPQTAVDGLLNKAVVANKPTGSLLIQGGTNAVPSAAGIADKNTLITRGLTVLTN